VGSITHCDGYRAAAVARQRAVTSIGIDAEPDQPLPDGVLAVVSLPEERALLERLPAGRACWDRLLFSAKESIFKTWYPLARRELDFTEATLDVDPVEGTFTARLLVDPVRLPDGRALDGFSGRWLARDGLVVTAIALPTIEEP
jgi:4'-phosphopantetheinyl transferase EntD